MLKVLSVSKISPGRYMAIKKDTLEFLSADSEDEILFILDQNGIINIRKFEKNVILGKNEKYISTSHIYKRHGIGSSIKINTDVLNIVNVDLGDQMLIIDMNGSIILRNNVILEECSQNIFNKNIGALIIALTSFNLQSGYTILPKEIIDILGSYSRDKVMFSLDEYGNVIVSNDIGKNLWLQNAVFVLTASGIKIHLIKSIQDILENPTKILWFFDEEGNVIIKNNLLPDICML